MDDLSISWKHAARTAGIAVAIIAALALLPTLLRTPEPPPLGPDVGLAGIEQAAPAELERLERGPRKRRPRVEGRDRRPDGRDRRAKESNDQPPAGDRRDQDERASRANAPELSDSPPIPVRASSGPPPASPGPPASPAPPAAPPPEPEPTPQPPADGAKNDTGPNTRGPSGPPPGIREFGPGP